ncbi:MAG: hypothetical protein EOM24_02965 [Chloroflexia bacterium]|nr:hypothetical protein [Chloroflexia bacterium]
MSINNDLFKLIFQAQPITGLARDAESGLTELWISLHSADPEANVEAFELGYTGYSRVPVSRTSSGWSVSAGKATLVSDLDFPACTAGAAVASYFAISSTASGAGQLLYRGAIYPLIYIEPAVVPRLSAGTEIVSVNTSTDWPATSSEPRFSAHFIGASFAFSMTHEGPSGPRMAQRLAQMLGDHTFTSAGMAGSSIEDFESFAISAPGSPLLLDRLPDFLIIDCTGSAFLEASRQDVLDSVSTICSAYDAHPDRARCEILFSHYPSYAGSYGSPFIAQVVTDGPGWEAWRADYADEVIGSGARLVECWEHWRPNMLPHPLLGNAPDYHPTDGSCKRAAAFYAYVMNTIWAAREENRISHDSDSAVEALARTRWKP